MTSFVREILSATGKLDSKEDLATKTARLAKRVADVKTEMRKDLEAKYADYLDTYSESAALADRLEAAAEEAEALRNTVERTWMPEVTTASADVASVLKQLEELAASIEVAGAIRKADEAMAEANTRMGDRDYLGAALKLDEVTKMIEAAEEDDLDSCDSDKRKAFAAIKAEFIQAQESLQFKLGQEWDKRVQISETRQDDGVKAGRRTPRTVVFDLSLAAADAGGDSDGSAGGVGSFSDLVAAMSAVDILDFRVGRVSSRILNLVLRPLAQHRVTLTTSDEAEADGRVKMTIKWEGEWKKKPDVQDVFLPVSEALDVLYKAFNVVVRDAEGAEENLLLKIGHLVFAPFSETLVKECLSPAVPSRREELKQFREDVVENALKLSDYACETGLVDAKAQAASPINAFADNVEASFADSRVAALLDKARTIAKEDIHLSQKVEETKMMGEEAFRSMLESKLKLKAEDVTAAEMPELEELAGSHGFSTSDSFFKFPECQVSQSCLKLMELVRETLTEATNSDPELSARLVVASKLMMELYASCSPVYHAQAIAQFPQHAALFFTSTFYLAHQCCTLGFEHRQALPTSVRPDLVGFSDQVLKLRMAGIGVFQEQLRTQRSGLLEILGESGFSGLQGEAHLPPKTERSLKQILHQMNHLRKVWQRVVPAHVYSRAVGVLLDSVVEELVAKVVGLEDIAADVAVQIVTLFKFVEEKAPDVFVIEDDESGRTSRHDVIRFVRHWPKFLELAFVLNSNLKEIEDRWAGGKGPLAVEFKVDEMKSLIRALFMNSSRRATVLARIK